MCQSYICRPSKTRNQLTEKMVDPKAAATPKMVTAPAKVVKPVAKASVKKFPFPNQRRPLRKLGASIAKLTERKEKINAEIKAPRDQRDGLKMVPVTPAPVAANAKTAPKGAAPKPAAKK